ncbi:hypothetical protein ACS0TY_028651 [Phlomoides rotata]
MLRWKRVVAITPRNLKALALINQQKLFPLINLHNPSSQLHIYQIGIKEAIEIERPQL